MPSSSTVGMRSHNVAIPDRLTSVIVASRPIRTRILNSGMAIRAKDLEKTVSEDLPYTFDFSPWDLLTTTELIVSAVVSETPDGLTIASPAINADGDEVSVRISGGTLGTTYRVSCLATTTSGYDIEGFCDLLITTPD